MKLLKNIDCKHEKAQDIDKWESYNMQTVPPFFKKGKWMQWEVWKAKTDFM